MTAPTEPPVTVHLMVLPETTPAVLYGLLEVLSAVGVAWKDLTGELNASRRIEVTFASEQGGSLRTARGIPLEATTAMGDAGAADIVIVTDLDLGAAPRLEGRWPVAAAWLRAQYDRGATIGSVCTGSLVVAESGLLDGLEATTHWGAVRLFAEQYPAVRLCADRLLCLTGPEHRIITSGGSASWTDLALYLIARFCGVAEATRIAKIFVIGDHSDGQLPFAAMSRHRYHEDAVIEACQVWVAKNYAEPSPVARMVRQSGLAERTFKRRFKVATGYAPVEYVQILRLEEAKQMLEASDDPVDDIARQVGYHDPAFFRRLFRRRTGVTPGRYRQRFRHLVRPQLIGS